MTIIMIIIVIIITITIINREIVKLRDIAEDNVRNLSKILTVARSRGKIRFGKGEDLKKKGNKKLA